MKSMKTSKTGKLENVWLHWLDIVLFKSSVLLVMHGTSDVREASLERQKVTLYDQLTFDYHALPGNISCVKLITFTLLPSVWASHSVCVTAFALKMHIHGNLLWNKCKLRIKWLYVSTHFVCFLLCIFVQWHSLDNISEIYDHASFLCGCHIQKKKVTIVTPPPYSDVDVYNLMSSPPNSAHCIIHSLETIKNASISQSSMLGCAFDIGKVW